MNSSSYEDYPASEYSNSLIGSATVSGSAAVASMLRADSTGHDSRPRIFLLGSRRSGKTSIERVVFQKMSPHETLFLEQTNEVRMKDISNNPFVQFHIFDFPGGYSFQEKLDESQVLFKKCHVCVFVIDAQDDPYTESLEYISKTIMLAHHINPAILFEVFIHKMDGDAYTTDDHKFDCQRDIQQRLIEELNERSDNSNDFHLSYSLTSIFDHSIFECMSKVVQKLIPQLQYLEQLLDSVISSCGIAKAFLFDVVTKIYIATDSTPVDMPTYELCSDMIDVVIDVSCIYAASKEKENAITISPYDSQSAAVIRLGNDYVLYLREVNKFLALVCLMREEALSKSGLVEYNFNCFKKAIVELFDANKKGRPSQRPAIGAAAAAASGGGGGAAANPAFARAMKM